jgi:hypothetical protein
VSIERKNRNKVKVCARFFSSFIFIIVLNIVQSDTSANSPSGEKFLNGRSSSLLLLYTFYNSAQPSTRLRGWQMFVLQIKRRQKGPRDTSRQLLLYATPCI